MVTATEIVDSWPAWKRGCLQNVSIIDLMRRANRVRGLDVQIKFNSSGDWWLYDKHQFLAKGNSAESLIAKLESLGVPDFEAASLPELEKLAPLYGTEVATELIRRQRREIPTSNEGNKQGPVS